MKRQEILESYNVGPHGVINSPGKFEADMLYAPYFYDLVMDGVGEEHMDGDRPISFFKVGPEDRAEFPELEGVYGVACYESDQGFFFCVAYDNEAAYEADIESLDMED